MKRFQKILVGIDLNLEGTDISAGSRRAALQAEWLARKTGASVTLLHSTWADLYEENDLLRPGLSTAGALALQSLAEDYLANDVPIELLTVGGRSWLEMVRRCNQGLNDLVLVARRNDAGRGQLGSVSRKLMRKCPVPVWVVKVEAPLLHERVLVATGLGEVGDRAVELGASIAGLYDCEMDILHAWQVPMNVQLSESYAEERASETLDKIQRSAKEHIESQLAALPGQPKATLHIGRDAPSKAIEEGVDKLHPDLLVMGTVSRSGIAGLLVGNTAERVLDRVDCSLLTIKPEGFVSPIK